MTKTILIVGASRGIGRATAVALAQAGRHLVLAARSADDLHELAEVVKAAGAEATVVACDVTAAPHVRRLVETAAQITGTIDMVVNSAGGAIVKPFEELTMEDWETSLRVGLTSVFMVCQQAAQHMQAGGLIVNVASVSSRQAFPQWSAYTAAKHGVLGFSGSLREELRPRGIRVTVVMPAATDTVLWDAIPGEWNRQNMMQPNDVAQAIAYLFSQPSYLTTEELVMGHTAGRL